MADRHEPRATREGIPFVVASTVVAALLGRLSGWAGWAGVAFTAWVAWFFRDPERACPAEPGVLYSPADGLVTAVDEVDGEWHVTGRAARVVIFLSPLDVHVNRSVPFVVVQVVGFLVRRIVTWRWPGETVQAGDRLGMLRFGSRTDLVLPVGTADVLVSRGQRVVAGITPVARFR